MNIHKSFRTSENFFYLLFNHNCYDEESDWLEVLTHYQQTAELATNPVTR